MSSVKIRQQKEKKKEWEKLRNLPEMGDGSRVNYILGIDWL